MAPRNKGGGGSKTGGGGGYGAWVQQEYLARTEQVVGVNPEMLDDLLGDEVVSLGLFGLGEFFLAGAIWLAAEKISEQASFQMTTTLWACVFSIILGGVFCAVSVYFVSKRRGKIKRIMKNTYVIGTGGQYVPRKTPKP
jgi:hypothetical protein